ncbi:TPA: hypothetical protein U1036_001675 [Streptococcus suis]|nr:hypothetical protein [Streptococcus suis]
MLYYVGRWGVGKNSTIHRRVRLPTPAQLIRSDLECKIRTNLPINHCADMLTLTLRIGAGLFAQPLFPTSNTPLDCLNSLCLTPVMSAAVDTNSVRFISHL